MHITLQCKQIKNQLSNFSQISFGLSAIEGLNSPLLTHAVPLNSGPSLSQVPTSSPNTLYSSRYLIEKFTSS